MPELTPKVRFAGIAAYLPPGIRSSDDVEGLVRQQSPSFPVPEGIVERMTGIRTRPVAAAGVCASDLAAAAGTRVLEQTSTDPAAIELLLFASASQDLAEPATANIVQEKIGTCCPVFDVKNACNSFLNGVQVAEALIKTGVYKTVLVTVGEVLSQSIKWAIDDHRDFRLRFPSYTFGDAGAAALLVPSDDERGITHLSFQTVSRFWDIGTLPGGGSMHPRGDEYSYFRGDGTLLKDAFAAVGIGILEDALKATGTGYADYQASCSCATDADGTHNAGPARQHGSAARQP